MDLTKGPLGVLYEDPREPHRTRQQQEEERWHQQEAAIQDLVARWGKTELLAYAVAALINGEPVTEETLLAHCAEEMTQGHEPCADRSTNGATGAVETDPRDKGISRLEVAAIVQLAETVAQIPEPDRPEYLLKLHEALVAYADAWGVPPPTTA